MAGNFASAAGDIVRAGRRMDQRGWVPATAGNISMRLADPACIAITRSGGHKGFLDAGSVIEVDLDGQPLRTGETPSAETLMHCEIYARLPDAGAVLHGHSVAGTVLSMLEPAPALQMAGYELFKAFGLPTHDATWPLPLFANDQDIARQAACVGPALEGCTLGFYIRGHGAYVWARTMDVALARLEALEFLLECELARRGVRGVRTA